MPTSEAPHQTRVDISSTAAPHLLWHPLYSRSGRGAEVVYFNYSSTAVRLLRLVYCGIAVDELRCRSMPWQVKFSLLKRRSLSPFIRSQIKVGGGIQLFPAIFLSKMILVNRHYLGQLMHLTTKHRFRQIADHLVDSRHIFGNLLGYK